MSKCWYCNEELTTANYCDEHIGICTKCYGLMFKVSNEFVKGLTDKISDLEAKLAESEKALEDKNKLIIQEDGECLLCGDGYCINNDVAKIIEENKKLKKQLELLDYEKTIKHYSLNRDLANPESEEMQKHLNRYVFKDKFRICCSMCGKTHEYEFKDIKYSDLFNDIYISCKSCPRSLNKLNFPEQAIAFYRTRYDLVCYEKHQDYLSHRNHISAFEDEINQLKQQLAEWKDGTIICKWTDAENKVKDLEHQIAEKEELIMFADRTIKGLVLAKEIDKISFAVEQLEKVKDMIYRFDVSCDEINNLTIALDNYTNGFHKAKFKATILIGNQIEQLKKESNNG